MVTQTVTEGSIDPNPGTQFVTHCPKCGQIFIDPVDWNDSESAGRCPSCGYLFEHED